jgi:hypothetical protein
MQGSSANDGVTLYRVVVANGCSDGVLDAAKRLAEEIYAKTGVECVIELDTANVSEKEKSVNVLLGHTNRSASSVTLSKLKAQDYVCKLVGSDVVIGGGNDTATLTAVERFIGEILPNANSVTLNVGIGFEYYGTYELGEVRLCGEDIRAYSLTATDDETYRMAANFRDAFAKSSGIYLDINTDRKALSDRKELIFKVDATVKNAEISRIGEDVLLVGSDAYSLSVAVGRFFDMLNDADENGTVSLEISDKLELTYDECKIRVASVVIDAYDGSIGGSKINDLKNALDNAKCEALLLGEMTYEVWQDVEFVLGDSYSFVEIKTRDGYVLPVAFDSSRVNVVALENTLEDTPRLNVIDKADNSEYTLLYFAANEVSMENLNATLGSEHGLAMAVMVTPDREGVMTGMSEASVVVYNSTVNLFGNNYRHVCAVAYPQLAFDSVMTTERGGVYATSFCVGPRYCVDYQKLCS